MQVKNWVRELLPRKLVSTTRALKAYLALPVERRAIADEILRSGLGLHGEGFRFFEDGLCTIHNSDFKENSRFVRAYEAGRATDSWGGWELRWRAYVICWCANWAAALDGDFVECGVNSGGNARMIIEYLNSRLFHRIFFLLDTFSGFVPDLLSQREVETVVKRYNYPDCLAKVEQTFSEFPFVRIIPGAVPGTLESLTTKQVAFLSIDMNCVAPEIAAANYFWPLLSPGAVVVLDDYGFSSHIQQKLAFDQFAKEKGVDILSLPTGQGIFFKPISAAGSPKGSETAPIKPNEG